MKNSIRMACFLVLTAFLSGCLYYGSSDTLTAASPRDTEASRGPFRSHYFDYPEQTIEPKVLRTRDHRTYSVQKLRFPNHTAYYHVPKGITKAPAVVVLPITNGGYHSESMANYLASKGFIALRMKSRKKILDLSDSEDPLKDFEEGLRDYVIDVLQGIDWLTAQPEVDRERIGITGISFGALLGVIVAGVDSRIKAEVFFLGGGDLAGIVFSSSESSVRKVREALIGKGDRTVDEVRVEAAERLRHLDPLTYAARLDPSRVLMVNAYFDRVIKRRYTKELWKAMGKPKMVQLPTGHYLATLFFTYAKYKTVSHFREILSDSSITTGQNLSRTLLQNPVD